MTLCTINVADMHCAACASKIRKAIAVIDGVNATHINSARRQVLVEHSDATDPTRILENIESVGFHPRLTGAGTQTREQKALLKRLGIAGLAMMQVMMAAIAMYAGDWDSAAAGAMDEAYRRLLEITSLIFCIPVVAYSATPFFRGSLAALKYGVNMDVPIAIAIGVAFTVSLLATLRGTGEVYYDSVVMFTFLLLSARYIDDRLKQRFDASSAALSALPAFAERIQGDARQQVALQEIAVGDRIWVAPGNQIPVDGILESERAVLDESILTGESVWADKRAGAPLFAGTVNNGPGFAIRSSAEFDRSRICDIAALADKAASANAPVVQFADRIARVFIPAILGITALTWTIWHAWRPDGALTASLAVLVVSCPCALSLAIPAALTAAMTRLRQAGIVLTRSNVLERAAGLTRALIDKTGTLTLHRPQITATTLLEPSAGIDAGAALDIAAALQQYANHPLARAFPDPRSAHVTEPEIVPGCGVAGRWHGRRVRIGRASFCTAQTQDDEDVYLAIDDRPVARFAISDTPRRDAAAVIAALRALGIPTTMVSGDADRRCAELARELNIDYIARQNPETKLEAARHLQSKGECVLVVGDGVNDVPALAAADVSVAVLESNDLVKSRADVLLLGLRLGALVDLVNIARRTRSIVAQNLIWALGYNGVAIPLAALGFVPPWLAALGMASSSTLVMLNASRLLRVGAFAEPVKAD